MDATQELLDGILAAMASHLGVGYGEIDFAIDPSRNPGAVTKKYGVVARQIEELTAGVMQTQTFRQRFDIVIADSYTEVSDDKNAREKCAELFDVAKSVYAHLMKEKCGKPDICLSVSTFAAEAPLINITHKTATIVANFRVTYRNV